MTVGMADENEQSRPIRPWPGPKPYREEDADRFFGREQEIERIQSGILRQRMTLLLAGSGVGKTSLLQAGVLPKLRLLREEEPEAIGPVVLVRQWGKLGPPEVALVHAVHEELLGLQTRACDSNSTFWKMAYPPGSKLWTDLQDLLAVSPPDFVDSDGPYDVLDASVGYVNRLTEVVGGKLVLIVDQAEELLGSGLERRDLGREQRTLDLFGNIFRRVQQCRLVLSLREEYRARLSPLRKDVVDLDGRQSLIEPLPRSRVRDAIKAAAATVGGVHLANSSHRSDGSILDIVLEWMDEGKGAATQADSVDLLRLQALLVEIFEYALDRGGNPAKVLIDDAVLQGFRNTFVQEADREPKADALGQQALERYIDRVLSRQESQLRDGPTGLIRRLVVRMAPWLSSPAGFKRHNRQEDLILSAIGGDLDVLKVMSEPENIREALRRNGGKSEFRVDYDPGGAEGTVSGWGWGRDQNTVGARLARAGFDALDTLRKEEILKSSEGSQGTVYELIHDGFGPALHAWADRRRREIGDTLASIVSQCGENFSWSPRIMGPAELLHVRWLGCNLSRFQLTGVTFRECDLRGTVLLDCNLEDCRFVECELDGMVFKGGSWKRVRWEQCGGGSLLFAGMQWRGPISFVDSSIENSSFEGVSLEGEFEAKNCSLRFVQLQSMSMGAKGAGVGLMLRECDVTNALIEGFDDVGRVNCLGEGTVLRSYTKSPKGRRCERI